MADDSFRGSCLKCGGPVAGGTNIHKECAVLELRATQSFGDSNKMVGQRQFTREPFPPKTIARIPDMNGVQVCERCGSIGQSRDFVSLSAVNMSGNSLHMPELISPAQLEKLQEDDTDLEFQSNSTLCRNCKTALVSFLHNLPTESGQAGPIAPRLPKGGQSETGGESTHGM